MAKPKNPNIQKVGDQEVVMAKDFERLMKQKQAEYDTLEKNHSLLQQENLALQGQVRDLRTSLERISENEDLPEPALRKIARQTLA